MASNNGNRGIPTLPSTLIRPTATSPPPPEPAAEAIEPAGDQGEPEQGRGAVASEPRRAPARRRRPPVGGETHGRKLTLSDTVFDRLQLLAIQRKTTASAIANEILDRNLPRLRIEREG